MIKKEEAKIISLDEIAQDTIKLVLKNEYISKHAKAGQFVHIKVAEHSLRRPISIASSDPFEQTITLLFKVIGSGTKKLASYQIGDTVDLLGPNGNPFPTSQLQEGDSVLLVGGGIGVPPLYFLAKTLAEKKVNVQAILGFQGKQYVFYHEAFKALCNVIVVTDDGSYGEKGLVTDYTNQVAPFSRYYSCGPLPMLKAVKEQLKDKEGYLSFEQRMACGIGACYACVIPTTEDGKYKKICHDGPVFNANEVSI